MSKDRVSGPHGLAPVPETEMSEEMLASRTPFQSALLAAGRADGLSPGRKEKLFRNLSVAIGVPHVFGDAPNIEGQSGSLGSGAPEPGTAGAGGSGQAELGQADVATRAALQATAKAAGVEGLAVKVVGAVAVTGALVWGGWQVLRTSDSRPESAAGRVVESRAVERRVEGAIEPSASARAVETVADERAVASPAADLDPSEQGSAMAKGARAKAKVSDSLAKELSLIDSARAALLRGEPAVALRTLNTYRRQFPRGALQAEATVQRVEALIATGDRASASRIGETFLKRYPESPYSRRIVSLLGGAREPQDGSRKSK